MSRIVFVSGFATGKKSAEKVGNALERYYEDVVPFTLSEYAANPDVMRKAAKDATLMTHSAGALSLQGAAPESAYLLNPPLPRRIGSLVARSVVKTGRMYTPGLELHNFDDLRSAAAFSNDATTELLTHPLLNFRQLPKIAKLDGIDVAIKAQADGVPTAVTWTTHDAYFKPTQDDLVKAAAHYIPLSMHEGQHDEVILNPDEFLNNVLNAAAPTPETEAS